MKKFFSLAIFLILIIACDNPIPNTEMIKHEKKNQEQQSIQKQTRIEINQIGVFMDELAYNDMRGIYIIFDNKTGKEFIGISGIGISDIGSHTNGKATTSDER